MASYFLSLLARKDLDAITAYSKQNWSHKIARSYVQDILQTCQYACLMPPEAAELYIHDAFYYRLTSGSHFVFYKISATKQCYIVRILHQRMDSSSHLGNA